MSTVLIVAPIVVANWGAISAAVTAVAVTMGAAAGSTAAAAAAAAAHRRQVASEEKEINESKHRAQIELENSEILGESTGLDQELVIQKDGYTARFSRDSRGALKVCVEGEAYSKGQLKQIGEDLVGRVTQQYAYHRIMTEMKERNMTVVHEEVDADRTVRIRVKNW